ncbi:Retrovirus-related Pol polyprotein from type-1 retrotransposable element R2 [Araneus ventricosus]|uniref:Retrovirus-related Pol polyprotein from type-1 retrotransposable element R2 n=1 Tax=Araneus ventricosus TaxID=182803 RepID=A0A4Y2SHK8_ARAVE|nr:Retrovirus-related Pol polyprotein from type-1 retrotransposable element R2 [Araneus ventricosus]
MPGRPKEPTECNRVPTSQNLTPPPSGDSRSCSTTSHPNAGPPSPPHECRGCRTKFTFKAHFDLHCAHCPAVLKKKEVKNKDSIRTPLNKCNKCPFVGKNSEALSLHTTVSHRSPKSASSKQQAKPDLSETPRRGQQTFSFDVSFANNSSMNGTNSSSEANSRNRTVEEDVDNPNPHLSQETDNRTQDSQARIDPPSASIQNFNSRTGNAINIIFPISGCLPCTESGCVFKSNGTTYNIFGLRNHPLAHKLRDIKNSGAPLTLIKPKSIPRRARFAPVIPEPGDESLPVPGAPTDGNDINILTPPATNPDEDNSILKSFIVEIAALLDSEATDEAFNYFCVIVEQAIAEIQSSVLNGPPRDFTNAPPAPPVNVSDPKTIQIMFKKNPRKAIRAITKKDGDRCKIPVSILEPHFSTVWGPSNFQPDFFRQCEDERVPLLDTPFTVREVKTKLKNAENTSPGPDRIAYSDWKSTPSSVKFLTSVFNACVHFRRIPPSWKTSTTVLLPKSGDPSLPNNWRPIALSATIYKMFTKCLAARLSTWCERYDILSSCQKGFTPHDGVIVHNYVLKNFLDSARKNHSDACIAWLDVTNAFGSIPHEAIFEMLTRLPFTDLIRDIYANSSTKILSDGGLSRDIPVQSGVKQGCPISGLLFNLCTDPIIRGVQADNTSHKILAFADDRCLLANTAEELQLSLSFVNAGLKRLGLSLNPSKSVALHVSGKQPVGVRDSPFYIDNNRIRNIAEGEFHKFLGKPVGFNPCPDYKHLSELAEIATLILESSLAPWQRIAALKTFFFPALQFPMRNSQFDKSKWAEIDSLIRPEIRNTLGLPEHVMTICTPQGKWGQLEYPSQPKMLTFIVSTRHSSY